jgi:copper homeostasis protein
VTVATPKPGGRRLLLEICAASADDCVAAERGGADRIELTCALMLGGLTPSLGLLREALAATRLPVIAMIRPRVAGFCYSPAEFSTMKRDAEIALAEGAAGIAFGILNTTGTIDLERSREIIRLAAGRQVVFHRAFDVVPEPLTALKQLIELGVTRMLTSGQDVSALAGAANIANFMREAAGGIEILPAGGIKPSNVVELLRLTGCKQVHASMSAISRDQSTSGQPQISFGGTLQPSESEFTVTDPRGVAELRHALE